ncbi:oxygen-independent coproporphyrinogen-3 oxidase [Ectothiorhodospira magna]|uniref:Oxygen-independent coproporphyrinogen-3 oxidase n=1 Tax=Ectothiorhodospira magna TaxID=867345 RepID=A0A1H9BYY3_9GAMM|nr:radical SAM protein [Ectothiorhodospira magna]SEP94170.1 oxygen-independent coproporphyrinogen-3 oxidase [Ectothiorhodospira magna]
MTPIATDMPDLSMPAFSEDLPYPRRKRSHHDAIMPLQPLCEGTATLGDHLLNRTADSRPRAIYLHIPFCRRICHFCNMRRMKGSPESRYADLLIREMEAVTRIPYVRDGIYGAVYFGGGTPSTLSTPDLQRILRALKAHFHLTDDVEITLESSLSDLDEDKLRAIMAEGVNRVSLGVQTFHDRGRQLLGRLGEGAWARDHVRRLRALGLDNLGMDLIYHYPLQSDGELALDLDAIAELDLAGFSLYSLMIREKSHLAREYMTHADQTPQTLAREWQLFSRILEAGQRQGFEILELTKMVRPDRDRYRYVALRYQGGDTLPLGAGAGGRLAGMMLMNPLSLEAYARSLEKITDREGMTTRPPYDALYRFIGAIQFGRVELERLPEPARDPVRRRCRQLVERHLLTPVGEDRHILTPKGVFWGNNLAAELAGCAMEQR